MRKSILIITDGVGYNEDSFYNAFYHAKKPTYDYLISNIPHSFISTYGHHVGLPDGIMGNSEVGHMSLGSGKVLYQDLVKINNAISTKEIYQNEILNAFLKTTSTLHLAILLSDGGVHSHINHLFSIIQIANQRNILIYLHLITDGRDVPPKTAIKYINTLKDFINKLNNVFIASISGRFFAMDRDNKWDRIENYYNNALLAQNKTTQDVIEYLESRFLLNELDEFITPISFGNFCGIKKRDSFLFLNYRSDRAREITKALTANDFNEFNREFLNLNYVCMCEYDESLKLPVLFPKDKLQNTLAEIISRANLKQAHIAETEKYAHVTFFFNGGREKPFKNEKRILIPSPNVKTYDLKPEMSASEVCDNVLSCMNEEYDFIVVNFANGDMVGHTGNFEASIKAVQTLDFELGRILDVAEKKDYAIIITSDHGNCEKMKDEFLNPLTNHTVGDVYCFVKSPNVKTLNNGRLSNIARTVLKVMEIENIDNSIKEMDEALF